MLYSAIFPPTNSRIVRQRQYDRDKAELVELSSPRQSTPSECVCGTEYPKEYAMSKTAVTSPELAPPVGPFSQAVEVGGFLYFSGQVGQDPATGKVVEGGIVAETERVFQNLSAVLKAAGSSFDHVVRAGVYLTSMSDFVAMNGIYAKYFTQP